MSCQQGMHRVILARVGESGTIEDSGVRSVSFKSFNSRKIRVTVTCFGSDSDYYLLTKDHISSGFRSLYKVSRKPRALIK